MELWAADAERSSDRDPYAVAGAEARGAIERLLATKVPHRKTRVFLAIVYLTVTFSKVGDRVYVAQIAAVARIPGDGDEYRHTRRAIAELKKDGVITWEPVRGRHKQSWVSLNVDGKTRPLLAALPGGKPGQMDSRNLARCDTENPASSGPPTEEVVREGPEEEDSSQQMDVQILQRPAPAGAGALEDLALSAVRTAEQAIAAGGDALIAYVCDHLKSGVQPRRTHGAIRAVMNDWDLPDQALLDALDAVQSKRVLGQIFKTEAEYLTATLRRMGERGDY